jgi:hypothetical protein
MDILDQTVSPSKVYWSAEADEASAERILGISEFESDFARSIPYFVEPAVTYSAPSRELMQQAQLTVDSWLSGASRKLDRLASLVAGWDGYGAEAPNAVAIEGARRIVELLNRMNFAPSLVSASPEGGVILTFLGRGRMASLEYYNSGELGAVTSDEEREVDAWENGVNEAAVSEAVGRVARFLGR